MACRVRRVARGGEGRRSRYVTRAPSLYFSTGATTWSFKEFRLANSARLEAPLRSYKRLDTGMPIVSDEAGPLPTLTPVGKALVSLARTLATISLVDMTQDNIIHFRGADARRKGLPHKINCHVIAFTQAVVVDARAGAGAPLLPNVAAMKNMMFVYMKAADPKVVDGAIPALDDPRHEVVMKRIRDLPNEIPGLRAMRPDEIERWLKFLQKVHPAYAGVDFSAAMLVGIEEQQNAIMREDASLTAVAGPQLASWFTAPVGGEAAAQVPMPHAGVNGAAAFSLSHSCIVVSETATVEVAAAMASLLSGKPIGAATACAAETTRGAPPSQQLPHQSNVGSANGVATRPLRWVPAVDIEEALREATVEVESAAIQHECERMLESRSRARTRDQQRAANDHAQMASAETPTRVAPSDLPRRTDRSWCLGGSAAAAALYNSG